MMFTTGLLLVVVIDVFAQDGSELVLFGDDLTEQEAQRIAVGKPVAVLPLSAVIDGDPAPARLYGVPEQLSCSLERVPVTHIVELLDQAAEALLNVEAHQASELLDQALGYSV